jgi:homoserine dehydrogenase
LLFEAAVAGGIPVIRALRESLRGEPVSRVMGIINGTTNFILTKMTEEGADYSAALSEAQRLGFAERDPTAHLRALINARADALPLPDGCAVIPAEKTHTVLWDDPLSALAILCKCADTVWLRSKNPSLLAIQQRSAVSLLVPPTFASRLPEKT